METITFEVKSLTKFQLVMVKFPELTSHRRQIQKGITILKKHAPKVLRYLSRQHILAGLQKYKIIIKASGAKDNELIKKKFKCWIQNEKMRRLGMVVVESIILPFTPFLALLPGPNIFFYIPALLFYYHLRTYLGLRKIHMDELDIKVEYTS
ncbi:MAG TPA: hypothetical protein VK186_18085 [Candidatus Deferrimicrobium sp.]|nr:hypothetical protein [Candidatus Kapabacteria bacterium]HLP60759.1 hypothetical protein [Candidatus Deferrimicrobium sp.]